MTTWLAGVSTTGPTDIYYRRTGGAKQSVVLLHGLTGSGACWSPLARALEDEFDVVMPDARGHGQSSTPPQGYRYDDHAADVRGLLDGLRLATPVLLGHSMGGMTAALAASQLGTHIRRVILVDPTFLSPDRQREVFESDVAGQHHRRLDLGRDAGLAADRVRHPHRTSEILELQADARAQTRLVAFDVLRPPSPDYREVVARVRVPILLVRGGAGAVVSREMAAELQRLNGQVRVEQISDAGHGIPYDQPDRLATIVRSFLMAPAAPPLR